MTDTNVESFKRENAKSPVISASVHGHGGAGSYYLLANGRGFDLTAEECAQVSPIWKGVTNDPL